MLLNLYKYNKIVSMSGNQATNEGTIAEAQDISLTPSETESGHRKTQVMEKRASTHLIVAIRSSLGHQNRWIHRRK